LLSAEPGALPCFDVAVRNCRAASIAVTAMGVDAGTHYVFIVKPAASRCQVTEQRQFYLVSGGIRRGPLRTTSCQVAAATGQGVTLSCDGQRLLIPATVSHGEAAS
jgi:hypothetical protein